MVRDTSSTFPPEYGGGLHVEAYAHTPAGKLMVQLPVTQEMLDDLPMEYFDGRLRDEMNRMIATSDELLRYRVSKLRERAALREAGGI